MRLPARVSFPFSSFILHTSSFSAKRVWQRFVLAALLRLSAYLQRLPRAKALRFGERLGNFAFFVCRWFVRRPYEYAYRNLRLTEMPHPGATFAERNAFIRRVFQRFCCALTEFMRMPMLTPSEAAKYTTVEGMEYVEAARAAGKGVIYVSGHFGNWEYLAAFLTWHNFPMTVVARQPEDRDFADWVKKIREGAGYRVRYRGDSMREILRALRRKEAIAILTDQNADDVFVPFFGLPAGTTAGPATLSLHTGAAILTGYCVLMPDGTYRIRLAPPIDTTPTSDREADIKRITADINRSLEAAVREHPDQWLWLHNRWKNVFDEGYRARTWNGPIDPEILQRWQGD